MASSKYIANNNFDLIRPPEGPNWPTVPPHPTLKTQNEEDITNTELQSVGGENLLRKSVVDSLQGEVKILAMIAIFLCITPPPLGCSICKILINIIFYQHFAKSIYEGKPSIGKCHKAMKMFRTFLNNIDIFLNKYFRQIPC